MSYNRKEATDDPVLLYPEKHSIVIGGESKTVQLNFNLSNSYLQIQK